MLQSKDKYDFLLLFLSLSLVSLTIGFGLFIHQNDFAELLFFYGFFFVVYAVICRYVESNRTVYFLLALALFLRLLLVFVMPNLSDDIYRFVWDGRLIINGISPFAELPTHYIENKLNLRGIDQNLYNHLNSPEYFTVYPPVPQSVFAWAGFIFPKNIWGSMLVMKSVLLLFEAGTFFLLLKLLKHYSLPQKNALLYALNPLVIWDTFANVHFEIAMVFFVLLALWFLVQFKWINSAIAMSFAVLSKLIPLILLPFLIRKLGWKKAIIYFLIVGTTVILCFLPFFNLNTIKNLAGSLDLYFQRFEYNASVYYAMRYIGQKISGYNLIYALGPILAFITAASIFGMAFSRKKTKVHLPNTSKKEDEHNKTFFEKQKISFFEAALGEAYAKLPVQWLFAMTIFLLLATTVHPWYLTLIIALCVLTRFRYPILWSGLIVMTYVNYSYAEFSENLWIVAVEYLLLFAFIWWEMFRGFGLRVHKSKFKHALTQSPNF